MRSLLSVVLAVLALVAVGSVAPAAAVDAPIGRLGDTLRVQTNGIIADVTVTDIQPSDVPPGFGYPPHSPRFQIYSGTVVVRPIAVPNPSVLATTFSFRGVTQTGDAYLPRNSDAPDALQYALQNAPQGSTVGGRVFWDCYRDLVSTVVLINPHTGEHLAQWNL
ncbi:hypothetical protein H7J51_26260 [Mycobacterium crocinum]|uniref:Exported alanine and valine rich protein n=1 Tax=Mycolicibacterium crocinum TaxID=388459 RepID=A0ABY3TR02_9MYCO|nr:hypothetical protein [Mycolicibacterium crocinum]MCV7218766.1 hypothetical protein [Mycolicibacterium crocinum]ULN43831.1 hypothetical protein MI149_12620 [Mycolicibacterium crocinum]